MKKIVNDKDGLSLKTFTSKPFVESEGTKSEEGSKYKVTLIDGTEGFITFQQALSLCETIDREYYKEDLLSVLRSKELSASEEIIEEMLDEYIDRRGDDDSWSYILDGVISEYKDKLKEENYYDEIKILGGVKALFANERINPNDVPEGMYLYHLRQDDDGKFATVEKNVTVNHAASIITKRPISFGDKDYISLTEDTSPDFLGYSMTIEEFAADEDE